MKKIVAVYPRVSSDDQVKEGRSFKAQINKLKDFCEMCGWSIYKIYDGDAGKTATINEESIGTRIDGDRLVCYFDLKKRPAFKEMFDDAQKGLFDEIVIWKWDRFSRNSIFQKLALIMFRKYGVEITPTDDSKIPIVRDIMSVISEQEPNKIRERVNFVLKDKFNNGIIPSKMPYGYFWNKEKRLVEVNEKRAKDVKGAFQMKLRGVKWDVICKVFGLAKSTYFNIIKNKVYYGVIEYKGEEKMGNHKPIISKELFDSNQKIKS